MFVREESVYIAAPPEAVFAYVSDVGRHGEWANEPLEITLEPGPQYGPGTRFRSFAKIMGGTAGQGEIVAVDAPHQFLYECEDNGGRYQWTFTLEPNGSGTRLRHRVERLAAPGWVKLIQPLMWLTLGRKSVRNGLSNIKANVESGKAAPA